MTDPVNLNRFRKAKARAEKKRRADANAVRFGRTKAERMQAESETSREARELDGKFLEKPQKPTGNGPERT